MALFHSPSIVTSGLVLCLDSSNPKSWSQNVFPQPLDIGAWATSGNAGTYSRDTTVTDSPAGGIPLKVVQTGNDPYTSTYNSSGWNLAPALVGQTWTVSVWVKASVNTTVEGPVIFGANSAGTYVTAVSAGSINVYTYWTRVSYTTTFTDATTAYIQARLDGTNTYASTITVWWDGLQVERASSASAFTPLTNVNGTSWKDLSLSKTSVTLNNYPTYTSGISGYFNFDGVDDYGQTAAVVLPTTNNSPLTLEAVCLTTTTAPAYQTVLGTNGTYSQIGFSGGNFAGGRNGGGGNTLYTGLTSISANTWYHMAMTYDGTNGRFYLNGSLIYTGSIGTNGGTNGVSTISTYAAGAASERLTGRLAIARVYSIMLSTDQVLQNFNAIRGRYGI